MAKNQYHHGDLRRALLEAAARLIARQGATRVSLREIAREAGVSHAAPYHHFEDRETILAEVAASGFEALREALARGAGGGEEASTLERLQGAGVAYVGFARENPEMYRLMFGGLLSDRSRYPALKNAADAAFGVLLDLLGAGHGAGERAGVNPVALATWSTVHGLASLLIEGLLADETASLTADEITHQVTFVLGRGLKSFMGEA